MIADGADLGGRSVFGVDAVRARARLQMRSIAHGAVLVDQVQGALSVLLTFCRWPPTLSPTEHL
jgi:hypothetical protein